MAMTDSALNVATTDAGSFSGSGLRLVSFIWIIAVAAALAASVLNGSLNNGLVWTGLAAIVPAVVSFALSPVSDKEWARVTVLLVWTALAVTATLAIAFLPMAFLFLCAPAAAVLFKREMVIEAMVLSALAAGAVWYASRWGLAGGLEAPAAVSNWAQAAGPAATIVFMVASMFAVAGRGESQALSGGLAAANDSTPADALKGLAVPVLRVDEDGHVLSGSDAAAKPATLKDGQQHDINDLLSFGPDLKMTPRDLIATAIISGETRSMACKSADDEDGDLSKKLLVFPRGDVADIVIADIADERARIAGLEAQSEQAGKDADSKTLFFAGVSHELRTPLNAIIGFSDMMRSRLFGPLPGKYSEYADLIHDSGQHMLDLIGDVLDISKIEAGKYELSYDDFDIADVTRSAMKMIRPAADSAEVILDADIDDSRPMMIRADRRAVRQIALNLLSNAVKFTPKGGRVTTKLIKHDDDTVSLSVEDTGAGMTEAELALAGTPYVQGKGGKASDARGTGLGLSLVRSLTELHGGDFALESVAGEGTTATVTLPAADIDAD